jgi:hypothetical protein
MQTGRRVRVEERPPAAGGPPPAYDPPYLAAGLAALGVFLLYAITLAPTTQFWDTSEYIATAHIAGIPHPPGNPLFVVLARTWDVLLSPFGLPVAVRINLFSAMMGALAHGCWFLVVHRILAYFSDSRRFRLAGAAVAVLVSASAFTVWNQSNVNEKVYTISLFTIALLSWLAFRWRDHLGQGKDDNLLLLMVFVLALSVGNHMMAFLAAPALLAFILVVHPRTLLNWKLYGLAIPVGLLGLSIHLFLPIRAGLQPVINEADPTCPSIGSALTSIVTMGRAGCYDLSQSLERKQYDKPSVTVNPMVPDMPRDAHLFTRQVLNYAQYFDWQWARSVAGNMGWFGGFRPLFTLIFSLLGVVGAWVHWQRDRKSFLYMGLLFATLSLGLTFYLNFKYGFTLPQALMRQELLSMVNSPQDLTEVRERDYFFIVSFSLWGLWVGVGLAALWQSLTETLTARGNRRAELMASPVLVFALLPLLLNWTWASRRNDYTARDWAYNLLMSIEPYGIVFTNGDNDTFPLWYLQEVEGVRRDVTVMVMSYLNTNWYVKQIKRLTEPCPAGADPLRDPTVIVCQRPYEPDKGPDIYKDFVRPLDAPGVPVGTLPPGRHVPARSIVPLSDTEIDTVANTMPYYLTEARGYRAGNVQTTLPQNDLIIPADAFLALIIQQAIEDRPVYFAMTTQSYEELKLRPYLLRQGVAYKLMNGPVVADSTNGYFQPTDARYASYTGANLDVARTEALVANIFQHHGGFPERWTHWVDSATEGIPFYYGFTHLALAIAYQERGDSAAAARHNARAEQFLRLGQVRENSFR